MVASSAASVLLGEGAPSTGLVDTPATPASVVAYLESGQRIRQLTDLALKVCMAVLVLVALAWALGVLPGAVKLF
jgi:hypothetical protein